MFAKYTYKPGANAANVLADIVALLTGLTNKALLSADCVQAATEIIAVISAGWSVFDAAAGTNKKCLSAPCANGSTKYVVVSTATSGSVFLPLYESWNAGTHAGTNVANASDTSTTLAPPINLTAGGTLLIGASERYLVMASYTTSWMTNGAVIIGEREPVDPWDTVAAGYPVSVHGTVNSLLTGSNYFYAPRVKYSSGDYTAGNAGYSSTTAVLSNGVTSPCPTLMARDANFMPVYPLLPISLIGNPVALGYVHQGGRLLGDLYATTANVGTTGDELPVGAGVYCIAKSSSPATLAFPKF